MVFVLLAVLSSLAPLVLILALNGFDSKLALEYGLVVVLISASSVAFVAWLTKLGPTRLEVGFSGVTLRYESGRNKTLTYADYQPIRGAVIELPDGKPFPLGVADGWRIPISSLEFGWRYSIAVSNEAAERVRQTLLSRRWAELGGSLARPDYTLRYFTIRPVEK